MLYSDIHHGIQFKIKEKSNFENQEEKHDFT